MCAAISLGDLQDRVTGAGKVPPEFGDPLHCEVGRGLMRQREIGIMELDELSIMALCLRVKSFDLRLERPHSAEDRSSERENGNEEYGRQRDESCEGVAERMYRTYHDDIHARKKGHRDDDRQGFELTKAEPLDPEPPAWRCGRLREFPG